MSVSRTDARPTGLAMRSVPVPWRAPSLAVLALTSCAPTVADGEGGAVEGGTAVLGVAAAATTVLPPLAAAALDFELGGALYLGLNFGEWEDGALAYRDGHPLALARSWELEGARLTYHLDTGRRWSDDQPIRAADVAFTFGLLADTMLALPLSSVTARIDSISTPDDSTAVFYFDREYAGMLFDTGVGILPEHVFGRVSRERFVGGLPLPDDVSPADLPASGPFRLAEWRPTERIVLVRNEASSAPALLERLVVRVVPDESTRAAELRSGGIHAGRFNSFRLARAAEAAGATLLAVRQRGYDYIAWNGAAVSALSDRDVRQALSLGIDREAIIGALDLTGFAEPAWGPYGSLFSRLRPPPAHEPLFDPDRARALLDAAGWVDTDGDGIRDREGEKLAIELSVPAGNDRREDAAEIIQAQLRAIGVEIDLRASEFNALFGQLMAGEYEGALMGWQVALDPDISPFWGDPRSPLNVVEFDEPEVAASIVSALEQHDAAAAEPHWRAAAEGIGSSYPYAFLWYFDLPFVIDSRLGGVQVSAGGWGAGVGDWFLLSP